MLSIQTAHWSKKIKIVRKFVVEINQENSKKTHRDFVVVDQQTSHKQTGQSTNNMYHEMYSTFIISKYVSQHSISFC